jgi:hypothetical protein
MSRKMIIRIALCLCLIVAGVILYRLATTPDKMEGSRKSSVEAPPPSPAPPPEPVVLPEPIAEEAPNTMAEEPLEPTAVEPEPTAAESPMPPPPAPAPVPPPPQPMAVSPKMVVPEKSMAQVGEEPILTAAETPSPTPEPSAVERYPTMECPDQVNVNQEFALMVSLTEDQITPDVKIKSGQATPEGALSLQLPKSSKGWAIDVVLSAPGFTFVKGSNNAAIQLPLTGDSTPALFHLKARQPKKPGKGENIYATFWHDGAFLAKVSKTLIVIDPAAPKVATRSAKAETSTATAPAGDTAQPPSAPAPASMTVHAVQSPHPAPVGPALEQVDLTIYVLENLDPDKPYQSEIIIASPWLQPTLQKYQTPDQADQWLQFHYDKFVKSLIKLVQAQSSDTDSEAAKTARKQTQALMEGFGDELYQKFAPEPLKTAFWHLVDRLGPEFDTIQIFSNNPVIPWELMRPSRPDGSETRNFLGIEFTIGRWHVSQRSRQLDRPPQSVTVEELVVVAPGYKPDEALPGQSEEMKMLAGFTGFRTTPGRLENVEKLLASSPNGIIHFAGHGSARPSTGGVYEYFITLEDTALDLTTFRGLAGSGAFLRNPFFFFNACEMGRSKKVADFVGGWAPAVLESGASGFIGALWPVDDQGAAKFAALFYNELDRRLKAGPVNVAELLRDARRLYLKEGNPTYLAFIYYGDPNLEFSRPKIKAQE